MIYTDDTIVIVDAVRTPIGAFNGIHKDAPAHKLGTEVIKSLLVRTNVAGSEISEIILGQIMTAYNGPNPARQAAINAGIPKEVTAYGINQLCGSGLKAVCLGYQAIKSGDSKIVIAGGQENMSRSPHAYPLRNMQNYKFIDTMMHDALIDPFYNIHTVNTAENIANLFNISREEQDAFATESQNKCEAARKDGKFKDEIVPISYDKNIYSYDELPRDGVNNDSLSKLHAVMRKKSTVTAGNASGISDGASVVMIMSYKESKARGLKPMAAIKSFAEAGVDPSIMGIGPIPASKKALEKANWTVDDLDLIEANEAFASQAIYVNREMKWDTKKVNVNGGAIAMGHPFGASGARVLTTLVHEMQRQDAKKALATLCIGGGMGIAVCLERQKFNC